MPQFSLHNETPLGRRGQLQTPHGTIETPFFMPVGTAGAMKGLTHKDLVDLGAQILLCNTYHLFLQPGDAIVRDAGGLHSFIGWDMPIVTDSGGFQVFSLESMRDITDAGVHFRSHINGDPLFLGPEESIGVQWNLGADIIICFDQCPPSTAPRSEIEEAVDRTLRWAKKCKRVHRDLTTSRSTAAPLRHRSRRARAGSPEKVRRGTDRHRLRRVRRRGACRRRDAGGDVRRSR